MRSVMSVLLFAVVGSGCSGVLSPEPIAGRWTENLSAVESSFEMDLTSTGTSIAGTGSWYGEACCQGTLAVTGTIKGIAVHLDIAYIEQFPRTGTSSSHFDGRLTSPVLLEGTLTDDSPNHYARQVAYHRG